jgi:putative ABC transport system ATP-binding protein
MPAKSRRSDEWTRDLPLILDRVHARRGGTEILRGIDLTFPPGSRTTLIGPSGAGKSTLLRLLNRLTDPTDGEIRIGETPLKAFPVTRVRRRVGLVFQSPRPLPGTVADGLAYPHTVIGHVAPTDLSGALDEVGLDPSWLDRDASGLSGGERQRLAIAVALQADPAILALDEPTSALDPTSARRVAEVLRRRSESDGLTTIVATHNREHTPWLGDRTVVLEAGRVVDQGPTAEVLARADESFWADQEGADDR